MDLETFRLVKSKVSLQRLMYVGLPRFKPEHMYLTDEGYPLGTTCWYAVVEAFGRRKIVCTDTQEELPAKVLEYMTKQCARFTEQWFDGLAEVEHNEKYPELASPDEYRLTREELLKGQDQTERTYF